MSIPRRNITTRRGIRRSRGEAAIWAEDELERVEREHPKGMTVQEIVDAFAVRGERLSEATFRKYVQLGLLPRSVRMGRKGKHRGSQGFYPATTVRQLDHIRRLMAQGFTIQEIQKEFLFVRGDIEALSRQIERIHAAMEVALGGREGGGEADTTVEQALDEARSLGDELLVKLRTIERRLAMRARMDRAVV